MMRNFDVFLQSEELEKLLNDENMYIEDIEIHYSKEVDFIGALVRYKENRFPEKRKWKRHIRRFFLTDGNNQMLDRILNERSFRVSEEFTFTSKFGGIYVVLDFEDIDNSFTKLQNEFPPEEEEAFLESEEDEESLEGEFPLKPESTNDTTDVMKLLEITQLQHQIDQALKNNDKEKFLILSERLNELKDDV